MIRQGSNRDTGKGRSVRLGVVKYHFADILFYGCLDSDRKHSVLHRYGIDSSRSTGESQGELEGDLSGVVELHDVHPLFLAVAYEHSLGQRVKSGNLGIILLDGVVGGEKAQDGLDRSKETRVVRRNRKIGVVGVDPVGIALATSEVLIRPISRIRCKIGDFKISGFVAGLSKNPVTGLLIVGIGPLQVDCIAGRSNDKIPNGNERQFSTDPINRGRATDLIGYNQQRASCGAVDRGHENQSFRA